MSRLDLALVALALIGGLVGYRRGLLVGAFGMIGFLVGALAGISLAVAFVDGWVAGPQQSMAAIVVMVLTATLSQAVLTHFGRRIRGRVTGTSWRRADSATGAALSAVVALVLIWGAAVTLRQAAPAPVSRAIGESVVLGGVDAAMPERGGQLLGSFRRLLDTSQLPTVFGGVDQEQVSAIDMPTTGIEGAVQVRKAAASMVQVSSDASACRQHISGSGFVYSPGLVMTNAHVVAGVTEPAVLIGGKGRTYPAKVVAFDSARDLAVLRVPGLEAPALRLSNATLNRADDVVLAGFPNSGPYTVVGGRVRELFSVRGPDIYGKTTVTRKAISVRAAVAQGSSGGPMLGIDGQVAGVVFAKSLENNETAYALQMDEVLPVAREGQRSTEAVATGNCTR